TCNTIYFRPFSGNYSFCNFFLKHPYHIIYLVFPIQNPENNLCGNIIREVPYQGKIAAKRRVYFQNIALNNFSFNLRKVLFQPGHRVFVQLHTVEIRFRQFEQVFCKGSSAPSHLQQLFTGNFPDVAGNGTRNIFIYQKMLSEGFFIIKHWSEITNKGEEWRGQNPEESRTFLILA